MLQIHPTTGTMNCRTPMKMVWGRSLRMPARIVPLSSIVGVVLKKW